VSARIEVHTFDNPEQQALYKQLIEELRCLVCQNQNLADSNAELALDLRQQTYEMIKSGANREEIVTYMVQRYGDFVLYRPPFNTSTALLWIGPFVILGIGVAVLIGFIRRRSREQTQDLSSDDHQRAERLLKQINEDTEK
jgi:cytochrome c-type biogenesis protein CcmH